ncbi:MAG: helix-turn-helix domain-containing protein [Kouleothrix sp.]
MARQHIVQPVYKALRYCAAWATAPQALALSEICYRVDLPKTTVFRYLQTLCACGFVSHDRTPICTRIGLRV